MSKLRNLVRFSPGKYFLTIFVASLIAMPSAHARLTAQHSQLWSQDSWGIDAVNEMGDQFGESLVSCDFDNDGQLDLAVGVPHEDIGSEADAGVVHVIHGTRLGLSGARFLPYISLTDAMADDKFGAVLASGDMNGDGYCDLAIAAPEREVDGHRDAGAVYIVYGSDSGLDVAHIQTWSQALAEIVDNPEVNDNFGSSLAVGDFDGNGKDDLAVGVKYEAIGTVEKAGFVNIIYAADDNSGLTSVGNRGFSQGEALQSSVETSDLFGFSLAAGDFDGNGKDDLAVGVPYEDIGDTADAGVVHVIYGTGTGLNEDGNEVWAQGFGIQGVVEEGDKFGHTLATGDFDGNGKDDLAISAPDEDYPTWDEGAVHVIYGLSNGQGLSDLGNQLWSQGGNIEDSPEVHDHFGLVLTVGDFDGNHKDDLAVGTPEEDLELPDNFDNAGVVNVIYAADDGSGLSDYGNQLWSKLGGEWGDIPGDPKTFDVFGGGLAAGDFDGNGKDDLAVGAPTGLRPYGGEFSVIYAIKDYGSLSLSAASQTVSEGDFVRLAITRTGGSQERVAVRLATAHGSATSEDYTSVSTVVPFADGEIQKSVSIATHDDGLIENKENFWVGLSDPEGGATLTPGSTSLLISVLDKQSCPAGQIRYEVPAPKIYTGRFYCAASEYVKAGDLSGGDLAVIVDPRGWLMYSAPKIYLYPGFRVESGGELHLGYPIQP